MKTPKVISTILLQCWQIYFVKNIVTFNSIHIIQLYFRLSWQWQEKCRFPFLSRVFVERDSVYPTFLSFKSSQITRQPYDINFPFHSLYIAVYTLCTAWSFNNNVINPPIAPRHCELYQHISNCFICHHEKNLNNHVLDSHMQMGILADHWLLFWQVIILSPMSSNPNWHSKRRTSPFRKPLPSW